MSDRAGWVATIGAGATLWIVASQLSYPREVWDVENWTLYLGIAYVICGALGFAFPKRPWRWPLMVMLILFPVMIVTTGRLGPLFVIGIVFLLAYSLPGMLAATLAALTRRWLSPREVR